MKQVSDFLLAGRQPALIRATTPRLPRHVTAYRPSRARLTANDPALLYYAGYLLTVDGANNPKSFVKGAEYLTKAIDLGYVDTNTEACPRATLLPLHCLTVRRISTGPM